MLSLLFLRIHTAQTRIAQLQPHFPAAARYRLHQLFQKMVQRTFLIRRQQNLTVDMFLDQMADTRIFAWLDRRKSAGEFCIGCCCFPAKTGIYAPQTKILVNSCFRSSDPPAPPTANCSLAPHSSGQNLDFRPFSEEMQHYTGTVCFLGIFFHLFFCCSFLHFLLCLKF